jgi:hypothetical protein
MIKDTAEFKSVTSNFIGKWTVVNASNAESLGIPSKDATAVFDFDSETVKFYSGGKLVKTAKWWMNYSGDELYLDDHAFNFTFFNYDQSVALYDNSGISIRLSKE